MLGYLVCVKDVDGRDIKVMCYDKKELEQLMSNLDETKYSLRFVDSTDNFMRDYRELCTTDQKLETGGSV